MAFEGCYFIFDDKSCHDFGLMIYNLGSYSQDDAVAFASTGSASEDHAANRYSSLFYGVKQDRPLSFSLVFGADDYMLDRETPLTRPQVAKIAEWLTGHSTMKWLSIIQRDLVCVRYKCYISDLRLITWGGHPWAFQCTVTCDSPFAYLATEEREYVVDGSLSVDIDNISSYKGYYRPTIKIITGQSGNVVITNSSDGGYTFQLSNLPANRTIVIDNENQIITDLTFGDNMYPKFNFNFFRMKQGCNNLVMTGDFTVTFYLSFPIDVGA